MHHKHQYLQNLHEKIPGKIQDLAQNLQAKVRKGATVHHIQERGKKNHQKELLLFLVLHGNLNLPDKNLTGILKSVGDPQLQKVRALRRVHVNLKIIHLDPKQ